MPKFTFKLPLFTGLGYTPSPDTRVMVPFYFERGGAVHYREFSWLEDEHAVRAAFVSGKPQRWFRDLLETFRQQEANDPAHCAREYAYMMASESVSIPPLKYMNVSQYAALRAHCMENPTDEELAAIADELDHARSTVRSLSERNRVLSTWLWVVAGIITLNVGFQIARLVWPG